MSLRRKAWLTACLTILGMIGILYFASTRILVAGFKEAERGDTRREVRRVTAALSQTITDLDALCADWAEWDDTYGFIEDVNERYQEANLIDETLAGLRLNLMLFIHSSGRIVFGKGLDLKNGESTPVPEGLKEQLSADSPLFRHDKTERSLSGLILLPEGPMLISARAILTSREQGPARGTLVFGRHLDASEISRVARLTNLSLVVHPFADPGIPADFRAVIPDMRGGAYIPVRPQSASSIAGYTVFRDVYNKPALMLRASLPREIYQQGQRSLRYLIFSLVAVGLVFAAAALLFLEGLILSPLTRLSSSVKDIGAGGNFSARVPVAGKDELSNLAGTINAMLEALEKTLLKLQEALAHVRRLSGLVPMCASCKKIRDDKGYWNQVEAYIEEHSEAEFTHGICPECKKRLYPELSSSN